MRPYVTLLAIFSEIALQASPDILRGRAVGRTLMAHNISRPLSWIFINYLEFP